MLIGTEITPHSNAERRENVAGALASFGMEGLEPYGVTAGILTDPIQLQERETPLALRRLGI